jgi:PAS domain S-box-containing protein
MPQVLLSLFSALRPRADRLAEETRFQVQMHRLFSLLGAVFIVAFGPLYALSNPEATDPLWARLGAAGLFIVLCAVSYVSRQVRRAYVSCMWVVMYVVMGWFATLTVLNRFSVDYAVGVLLVYAVLAAAIGFGARSTGPVLWFLMYGFLLVAGGMLVGFSPDASPSILLASMGTIAIAEGVLTRGWLQIRERIREQESRLRGLANSLPGVVFQFYAREDGSVGHHFVSEHAEEVLGIDADPETFHERCLDCIPESAREEMNRSVEQAIAEETRWEFETPFDRPDDSRIWAHGTSVPERRENEVVFNGVILDITDRREAEQALEEERDRLETLFEALPTPVVRCVATEEGVHLSDANAAFENTFGLEAADVKGREINELLVPEEADRARTLDRRVLEEGLLRTEVQRTTTDGIRDFQLQVACRHPRDGPPEIFAVYTDITERKQRERRIEAIFNQTYQFTGLLEPDGTVIEVNDAALQFGDLEREEVVGKPLWDTHWAQTGPESKQRLRDAIRRAAEGEFVRYERPVQGSEETRMADFSIRPVTNEQGEVTLLIPEARDITELKRRERRLRAAKEEAEEARAEAEAANRAKSALLANMSHEVRTPLTSVLGFAEAIGEEVGEGTPAARFAGLIEKSGRRLLNTLNGVLNLSKLEAEEMDLEPDTVNLSRQARNVAEEFRPRAEEKGVDLRLDTGETAVQARASEKGIQLALQNLVSNAIKYTEEGEVVLRTYHREAAAILEVTDTGIGMEDGKMEVLFDPFRQESEGRDREYEGTGLGLTVTKRAVEQMGGAIEVATEKGKGSRFTIRLPLDENEGDE